MNVRVPIKRKDYVRALCRKLAPGIDPAYVEHLPLVNKPFNECFMIVPEHIAIHGGKPRYGWALFELKRVWLEAEFHVVWEREDGVLIDLSPRPAPLDQILFLPDPKREYEGIQVQSVFHRLSKKESVKRFLSLTEDFHAAMNEGDLANVQSGYVQSARASRIKDEMNHLMSQIAAEHF
jgi:hypothetical protein